MSGRFFSTSYMQSIRDRVERGDEPLRSAFNKLMVAADEALEQSPLSIRDNGGSPWYRQDAVYVPQLPINTALIFTICRSTDGI